MIVRKYFVTNPKLNKIDDTIKKFLRIHYRKIENILVLLSVKLLLPSNQLKIIRRQYPCHRNQGCIKNVFVFCKIKIIKEQLYCQLLELIITFVSRYENIIFDHYVTKPKSMLEWKILAMFDKFSEFVNSFDYEHDSNKSHPLLQEFFDIYLETF